MTPMRSLRAFLMPLLAIAAVTVGAVTAADPAGAATGSIWKVEATVNPQAKAENPTNSTLADVSASGLADAWAVGTFMNTKALDEPLAEHRNGTTVKITYTPSRDATRVAGVPWVPVSTGAGTTVSRWVAFPWCG
jgi:hypothetical protein